MIDFDEFRRKFVNKQLCVITLYKPFVYAYYYESSQIWEMCEGVRALSPYRLSDLYINSRDQPTYWRIMPMDYLTYSWSSSKRCLQ